jgi:hypothetical protein
LLSIVLFIAACGNGGAHFTTQTASGFGKVAHTVSVLGVYQDGRMAVDRWSKVSSHLVAALGAAPCDIAFDTLVTANQELASAIDERSRGDGPTSELLAHLAPAAKGDLLMVLTLSGKPPEQQAVEEAPLGAPVNNSMVTQQKRKHQAPNAAGGGPDPNRFEVSAALFSVAQNRPVARVSMIYRGQSVEDALTRFGAELAQAIPGSRCVGWNWAVKVDPATLRTSTVQD